MIRMGRKKGQERRRHEEWIEDAKGKEEGRQRRCM